ncbi:MAG TPA: antibiotic biosynthesis monooxygenase family protein [Nocardioidaceae bacterium]|nr:antibiotic biosynthesis monooxygenase family protein [Nocardioidaceae bacterium]
MEGTVVDLGKRSATDRVIHELAHFPIQPGREEEFEQSMLRAREVVAASPGFVSIEWWRGVERPSVYAIHIVWESVEAHVSGFRESPAFDEWKALTRPYFDGDVSMEHFEPRSEVYSG